ncbi:MAG: hypothetical protein E7162_05095 [Firmicutes bacterium]|nr:hypothetical protein [Bacillota bacterium]
MLGFYNYTVILTYMSLFSAIFGITFAFEGHTFWAVFCLLLSGFCDMFDGKVAKTMKRTDDEKKFGIQIDSLSDVIAFGVLPAAIGYSLGLTEWWGKIIMATFVLAALIRLAYFNVMEEKRQAKTSETRKEYLGLPVTTDALIFPLVYAFKSLFTTNFHLVYGGMLLLVAFLFLFKFKVKKPKLKGMILMTIAGVIELALLIWLMTR